jgi:hypothetical protein
MRHTSFAEFPIHALMVEGVKIAIQAVRGDARTLRGVEQSHSDRSSSP